MRVMLKNRKQKHTSANKQGDAEFNFVPDPVFLAAHVKGQVPWNKTP
jgi:hypothetical protein